MEPIINSSEKNESSRSFFVHSLACVESAKVGVGTRIWAYTHVLENAVIGSNCNICDHCFIESGALVGNGVTVKNGVSIWDKVIIEDDVFVGPHVVFTNDPKPRAFQKSGRDKWLPTKIKKGATLGAGSIIVCGVTIGEYAFVGAGAVVTKDIPPFAKVFGNPAVIKGYLCPCTKEETKETSRFTPTCKNCEVRWKPVVESIK